MCDSLDSLAKRLTFDFGNSSRYAELSRNFNGLQSRFGVYFRLSEFLYSETAVRHNLRNEPNDEQFCGICKLLVDVLYNARIAVGVPIHINSGFRSVAVNSLVGGVSSSRHLHGLAADVWCCDMTKLWRTLSALPHRELIQYKSFIHVAL